MDYKYWLDFAPSALSALAGAAAVVAAFNSLKVSRESKAIAEQSALAIQHSSAAQKLSAILDATSMNTSSLQDIAMRLWNDFPRELEKYDCRAAAGIDPRPIRHVVSNAGEMLERYASHDGKRYDRALHGVFSVVRQGMAELSDIEYKTLLRKADRTYVEFEGTFGVPNRNASICEARAFRWAFYQLDRRVGSNDWIGIWNSLWESSGLLRQFSDECTRIAPFLKQQLDLLQAEMNKLQYAVFPLDRNKPLHENYTKAINTLEGLIEVSESSLFEIYQDDPHLDDLIALVLASLATAILTCRALEDLSRTRV